MNGYSNQCVQSFAKARSVVQTNKDVAPSQFPGIPICLDNYTLISEKRIHINAQSPNIKTPVALALSFELQAKQRTNARFYQNLLWPAIEIGPIAPTER
jgi:hypothetical protein